MKERFLPLVLTAALASSCTSPSESFAQTTPEPPKPTSSLPPKSPETSQPKIEIDLSKIQNLFLPYGSRTDHPWHLLYGPHYIGDNPVEPSKRNAIDIAPPVVVPCTGDKKQVLEDRFVASASAGKVLAVGNENDRNDKNHSIVWVETDFGLIFAYVHLANIFVKPNQRIEAEEFLGNPSCEYPPGGRTTGIHLHFAIYDKNYNPVPIEGLRLSGWTIKGGAKVGEGAMVSGKELRIIDGKLTNNELVRIADGRRCATLQSCGGARNDIPHPVTLDRP